MRNDRQADENVVVPERLAELWTKHRGRVGWLLVTGIPLLITYITFATDLVPWVRGPEPPPAMSGDYNVAVADFSVVELGNEARAEGQSLADGIYPAIRERLDCGRPTEGGTLSTYLFECQPPSVVGSIDGRTVDERASAAARMAETVNANVVLYGAVEQVDGGLVVRPEMFLSARGLLRAEELVGAHEFGETAGRIDTADQRRKLRDLLARQAESVAELVLALSHYEAGRFEQGLSRIRSLLARSDELAVDNLVLHLIAGNLNGKLGRYKQAESHYSKTIAQNEPYARGLIGLAEVQYLRSAGVRGSCAPSEIDEDGLRRAKARYRQAAETSDDARTVGVTAKAAFGEGRVLTCLSQANRGPYWQDAYDRFQEVIETYEDGAPGLRELASESYSLLAFIETTPRDGTSPERADYERAIDYIGRAIALASFNERRAYFRRQLEFARQQFERM